VADLPGPTRQHGGPTRRPGAPAAPLWRHGPAAPLWRHGPATRRPRPPCSLSS